MPQKRAERSLCWLRNLRGAIVPCSLLGPNILWLLVFMIGPLLVLGVISFKGYKSGHGIIDTWQISNYTKFLFDPYYLGVLGATLRIGAGVMVLCLVLGFPLAYVLSRSRGLKRSLIYFAILMPLLTSAVVRTFGWMILLGNNGFINQILMALRIIDEPVRLMYNLTGVIIALGEVLLPFMVLALDAALLNIDVSLYEAAQNLGADRARVFFRITLPLSLPGIIAGSVLVFTLAISSFITPSLIGGARVQVIPTVIYQQALTLFNWPFGAAIAFIMLFTTLALLLAALTVVERRRK